MSASRTIVEMRKPGRTLATDRKRAPRFESAVRGAIRALFALFPTIDWPGLSRTVVQEAIRWDAGVRGAHEASTWAAAQARKVDGLNVANEGKAAAERLFSGRAA